MWILILAIMLVCSVIDLGIRLAWGTTKLVLGLIFFCPMLLVLMVIVNSSWVLPLIIIGLLCSRVFKRI